jgi:hypothetical protein
VDVHPSAFDLVGIATLDPVKPSRPAHLRFAGLPLVIEMIVHPPPQIDS